MKNTLKAFTAFFAPVLILTSIFFTNVIKANPERKPAVETKEAKSVKGAVYAYLIAVNNVK